MIQAGKILVRIVKFLPGTSTLLKSDTAVSLHPWIKTIVLLLPLKLLTLRSPALFNCNG